MPNGILLGPNGGRVIRSNGSQTVLGPGDCECCGSEPPGQTVCSIANIPPVAPGRTRLWSCALTISGVSTTGPIVRTDGFFTSTTQATGFPNRSFSGSFNPTNCQFAPAAVNIEIARCTTTSPSTGTCVTREIGYFVSVSLGNNRCFVEAFGSANIVGFCPGNLCEYASSDVAGTTVAPQGGFTYGQPIAVPFAAAPNSLWSGGGATVLVTYTDV